MGLLKIIMKWWVKRNYNEMCNEFEHGCPTCYAWLCYYYLFDYQIDEKGKSEWTTEWNLKTYQWDLVKRQVNK